MEAVYTDRSISISEFKKNPAQVVRDAEDRPVAVLSHNKPAFYMVQPALFEALLEQLADLELAPLVLERLAQRDAAVEVDIDEV
jgi:antitoxin StbD